MSESKKNVVTLLVVGGCGHGKSSVVNLLLGERKAKTSGAPSACTTKHQSYVSKLFTIVDTVAWPESGGCGLWAKEVKSVISQPDLILVVRAPQACSNFFEALIALHDVFPTTPRLAVMTHCDTQVQSSYWENSKTYFEAAKCQNHVGVCCTDPQEIEQENDTIMKTFYTKRIDLSKSMLERAVMDVLASPKTPEKPITAQTSSKCVIL